MAKVLEKVLRNDRVDEETKERAKAWVQQAAKDPTIRKMFREATEPGIESFLMLPEQQQLDTAAGAPQSMLTQAIKYLKDVQLTLRPEDLTRIEARLTPAPRTFGWVDVVWMLVVLLIVGMAIKA